MDSAAQVLLRSSRRSGRCLPRLPADFSELVFGERGGSGSYSVFERLLCRGRNFPCTGLRGEAGTSFADRLSDSRDERRRSTCSQGAGIHAASRRSNGEQPLNGSTTPFSSRLLCRETEDIEVSREGAPWGEVAVSEGGLRRRRSLCAWQGSGQAERFGGSCSGAAHCDDASRHTLEGRRVGREVARQASCLRAADDMAKS
mmetsp:Transcript_57430/g.168150  ORF Transcript_57430/g.168150 Transcript_57430/m.168150 type:complete len:201 (-) Transcript_57430:9-611(-)